MDNIDDEWSKFIANQSDTRFGSTKINNYCIQPLNTNNILDDEIDNNNNNEICHTKMPDDPPNCEDLYISTKTKVLFLNQTIDIYNIFWNIPIINYWQPEDGILKKQIKIVSNTPEEFANYQSKLENISYYNENIIKQINNPSARRLKYKDERKITVGMSKKDIMNCRGKVKNAFYNCFAIIMRINHNGVYREMHVKVFNTGKMEIPGVINDEILEMVKERILNLIQQYVDDPLEFMTMTQESNILINSNFNCGYFLNRDMLHSILRSSKYGIETSYDPCSYPGVKCKYYYNNKIKDDTLQTGQIMPDDRGMKMSEIGDNKNYTEISFMIFRTGSCLIVGNCSERILNIVYQFIKQLLFDEYSLISVHSNENIVKTKKTKIRKKTIWLSK